MTKFFDKFISKDDVNTGRQLEFDFTKALCIFFMVLTHTYIELCPISSYEPGTLSYNISTSLCNMFGAAAFMVCMGIGFCYSRNKDNPNYFISRGIKIFILSYVLNFLRSLTITFFVWPKINGSFISPSLFIDLFNVDIMQFAGVAMITFGLLLKFKLKPVSIFIVGLILSLISSVFPYFSSGNGLVDLLLGVFIPNKYLSGEEVFSCFPLISYFIFPAFGYLYGIVDRKIKDKRKYYLVITPICGIIGFGHAYLANKYNWYCLTDLGYYHPLVYDCLINICSVLFLFGVLYYISTITPKIINKFIIYTSSNINTIYCIHWVILHNLFGILCVLANYEFKEYNQTLVTLVGILIYVASVVISKIYIKIKKRNA